MRIAIIGAGFTGLACAYQLSKQGFDIIVFEKESLPGGLAFGFKEKKWQWPLEKHYHHLFLSDSKMIVFAKKVGAPIVFSRPETKSLIDDEIYPLDSPLDVLKLSKLSLLQRVRMGAVLGYLRMTPHWKPMEKKPASFWLPRTMGEEPYKILWEPLLSAKFGEHKDEVPLSWFWARIKKRSSKLGYPEGGFQNLAFKIQKQAENFGAKFYFQTEIKKISQEKNKIKIADSYFDKAIFTTSPAMFLKIVKDLPNDYINQLEKFKALASLTLILILKKQFLEDNTYWLNICNKDFPFLTIVEHTNFIDKTHYGNQHIVYMGKYLTHKDPYLAKSKDELLKIYNPFLKKINKDYKSSIIDVKLFVDLYAQPVITLNYSKILPSFKTPVKNLYLACMHQVYPWDRGTNYAIELGEKVAKLLIN